MSAVRKRQRAFLIAALREAGYAVGAMADLASDPVVFQRRHPHVDDEMIGNAVDRLVDALRLLLEVAQQTPEDAMLLKAVNAFVDGDFDTDTAAEDAAGVRAGSPQPAA